MSGSIGMRVGIGYDAHPLVRDRSLIVGGVEIPSDLGSDGHSDGDVLIHSMVDAIFGAVGLGDIGSYFPSDDNQWKNAESKLFLQHATIKIKKIGWEIENIDSVVLLQKPKISNHIHNIKRGLSNIMNIKESQISIKATTTDRLGYIGEQQGWAAQTVVLVRKIKNRP